MILIIGGFAQGKLHYVEQHYVQREDRQEVPVLDGTLRLASDSKITWATESAVETLPGKQTEQPTGRQTATETSLWGGGRELTENAPAEFWKGWRRRQMRW